jgi:membrane protease YdiL (CAAX protease family)
MSRKKLAHFGILVLAAAAWDFVAHGCSRWAWQSHEDWIQRWDLNGWSFYLAWLAILVVGVFFWPSVFACPWRPTKITARAFAVASGVTSIFYASHFYSLITRGFSPRISLAPISGMVLAPLTEEWIFRGVLWKSLVNVPTDRQQNQIALVATSLLFGFWHLPFAEQNPTYNLFAHMLFGVFMGALRWRYDTLFWGFSLHALGNGLYFLIPRLQ